MFAVYSQIVMSFYENCKAVILIYSKDLPRSVQWQRKSVRDIVQTNM